MRRYSEAQLRRLGAITLVVMLLVMAAAFNLSKFPGFRGTTYHAVLSDASGLHTGNMVQVGGIRVGRVDDVALDGATVRVGFEVDNDVELGEDSRASVEVLNLLGEKYLELTPAGPGRMAADQTIPLERTQAAYDIVGVFGDLTTTTERIDTGRLTKALDTVSGTLEAAGPEVHESFRGIARLSRTVASRDDEVRALLSSSRRVTKVLAARSEDIVDLMGSSGQVFEEVQRRKEAIHELLVNARSLGRQLRGVAADNQQQIAPALEQVDSLLDYLNSKEKELKATLAALGPYVSILGNIIGTGPWFDAYVANLLAIPTGEFVPGPLEDQ